MHTVAIILGVILAIPILAILALLVGLAVAESRGENPFM